MRMTQLFIIADIARESSRFLCAYRVESKKKGIRVLADSFFSYRLWDSNPHSFELDFESSASTNSAKPACEVEVRLLNQRCVTKSSIKTQEKV